MLSPSDFVALFSALGGSAYGTVKGSAWPDTPNFRFVLGLQSSIVFLLAFAGMDYFKNMETLGYGVRWTSDLFTTAIPVFIYLLFLLAVVIFLFHLSVLALSKKKPDWLKSWVFTSIVVLAYILIGYHSLTLEMVPVNIREL